MDQDSKNFSAGGYANEGPNRAFPQQRHQSYGPTGQKNNPHNFTFQPTPEEKAVAKECQSESFWRRCVPFCIASTVGVSIGFQYGYFKPMSTRWKALHYAGAIGISFVAGKASYVGACIEKFKKLKRGDSQANAEMLRDDLHRKPYPQGDIYNDPDFFSASGFPSTDQPPTANQNAPKSSYSGGGATLYDDLRRRNRDQHYFRNQQQYGGTAMGPYPPGTATADKKYPQETATGSYAPQPLDPYPPDPFSQQPTVDPYPGPGPSEDLDPSRGTVTEPYQSSAPQSNDRRSGLKRKYDDNDFS